MAENAHLSDAAWPASESDGEDHDKKKLTHSLRKLLHFAHFVFTLSTLPQFSVVMMVIDAIFQRDFNKTCGFRWTVFNFA